MEKIQYCVWKCNVLFYLLKIFFSYFWMSTKKTIYAKLTLSTFMNSRFSLCYKTHKAKNVYTHISYLKLKYYLPMDWLNNKDTTHFYTVDWRWFKKIFIKIYLRVFIWCDWPQNLEDYVCAMFKGTINNKLKLL